jgi:hypothetical protein
MGLLQSPALPLGYPAINLLRSDDKNFYQKKLVGLAGFEPTTRRF